MLCLAGIELEKFVSYQRRPILTMSGFPDGIKVEVGNHRDFSCSISNTGKSDLIISRLATSCGCFSSKINGATINPGKSVQFPMRIRDVGGMGKRSYQLVIETNEPGKAITTKLLNADFVDNFILTWSSEPGSGRDAHFLNFNLKSTRGEKIISYSLDSSSSWYTVDLTPSDGEIVGRIKMLGTFPEGWIDSEIAIRIEGSLGNYIKKIPVSMSRDCEKFSVQKSFSIGRFSSEDVYSHRINVTGFDPMIHKAKYIGSDIFSSEITMTEKDWIEVRFIPTKGKRGVVDRGRLSIFSIDGEAELFSYPTYICY